MQTPLIEIINLEFAYTRSQKILDIPHWRVNAQKFIFLYGPSGCGKSTLLSLLAGIHIPSKGSVRVLGSDLTTLRSAQRDTFRRDHIGYIFQQFNLIPFLSVAENIILTHWIKKTKYKHYGEDPNFQRLVEELQIADILEKKAFQISVGQAQRVAAARALIRRPAVLLADEPTSSLDTLRRQNFLDLLFQICREIGTTMVFVSHDLGLASLFDETMSLPQINKVARQEKN